MSFCLKKLALPERYYLSRSLQPPFSEFAATFLPLTSSRHRELSTFNFQLKKNGSFKHSHDNQPSSEHQ